MPQSPLTLLHLSDLHFGQDKDSASARFDQDRVTRLLLADAKEMKDKLGAPSAVLLTGDVAFSAQPAEYELASKWLEDLATAVGVEKQRILIVPGNHDVDRKKAVEGFAARTTHQGLRAEPLQLNDLLLQGNEKQLEANLWPKLTVYASFAAAFGAPAITPASPFWKQPIPLADPNSNVVAVGLNTCLLSFDGNDAPTNLAVGLGQLERAFASIPADSLVLVMGHHPPTWLVDQKELMRYVQKHPHILFTGHVHEQGGLISHPIHTGGVLHFTAGAGHHSVKEAGKHAYAWYQVSSEGVRFWPRFWSGDRQVFQAERNALQTDGDGLLLLERGELPKRLRTLLANLPPLPKAADPSVAAPTQLFATTPTNRQWPSLILAEAPVAADRLESETIQESIAGCVDCSPTLGPGHEFGVNVRPPPQRLPESNAGDEFVTNVLALAEQEVFGRLEEKRRIERALLPGAKQSLIVVQGPGGAGKSALVRTLLEPWLRERKTVREGGMFDAVLWTTVREEALFPAPGPRAAACRTLAEILDVIARAFCRNDILQEQLTERQEIILRILSERRVLLVVDNFESELDRDVSDFFLRVPGASRVIITTRMRLGIGVPIDLSGLRDTRSARQLLDHYCKRSMVELTPELRSELLDLTGRLPGALIWAVSQMSVRGIPRVVLRRMPIGDAAERYLAPAIRALITSDLDVLRTAAMFAGPVSLGLLAQLLHQEEDTVEDSVAELYRRSLVENQKDLGGEKLILHSLLPLTRDYVRCHYPPDRSVVENFVRWHQAQVAEKFGTDYWLNFSESVTRPTLGPHVSDTLRAVSLAGELGWLDAVRDLVIGTVHPLWEDGYYEERVDIIRFLLCLGAASLSSEDEAWLRCDGLAFVHMKLERFAEAEAELKRGRQIADENGFPKISQFARVRLALLKMYCGAQAEAEAEFREIADQVHISIRASRMALEYLGTLLRYKKRPEKAVELYDRWKDLLDCNQYRRYAARLNVMLAHAHLDLGKIDEAKGALALAEDSDSTIWLDARTKALRCLGSARLIAKTSPSESARLRNRALILFRQVGDRVNAKKIESNDPIVSLE